MTNAAGMEIDEANRWRLASPGGQEDWLGGVRASDANKYYIASVDTHMAPPPKRFRDRIDERFRDRLPRIEVKDGAKFIVMEDCKPTRLVDAQLDGEDKSRADAGATFVQIEMLEGNSWGPDAYRRIDDQQRDGVDAEVVLPNGPALLIYATQDPKFAMAQARIWNDWVIEACRPDLVRLNPADLRRPRPWFVAR